MNKFSIATAGILTLLAAACTTSHSDLSGNWTREAEEPAMFLKGSETLAINRDSTFSVTNAMLFSHADSALDCSMNLLITANGTWSRTNQGDLLLRYDAESVKVVPDSTSFRFVLAEADTEMPAEASNEMFNGLVDGITAYYTNGYASISAAGGMLFTSPQIIENRLFAQINGNTLSWENAGN